MIISFLYFGNYVGKNLQASQRKIVVIDDPISEPVPYLYFNIGQMIKMIFLRLKMWTGFSLLTAYISFMRWLFQIRKNEKVKNCSDNKNSDGSKITEMKYEEIQTIINHTGLL